jgi:photosystem II stability/assembly factor-like uncharacterized protein
MSVILLLGTTKGAFLLTPEGEGWAVSGPHCGGWPINHMAGDPESGVIWAAGGGEFHGAGVWRSEDGGESWVLSRFANGQMNEFLKAEPEMAKAFGMEPEPPAPFDGEVVALWSIRRAGGRLYAGAKPAALFESRDGGESWAKVEGLTEHPSARQWEPGAAGLVLHTILDDPEDAGKLWVGISAAGVFATEDGGATWERRNRLSNAEACEGHAHPAAGSDGNTGMCVHNMARAAGDVIYQQNHHGVFRSGDGGRSWDDITEGLPSHFGFPIGLHPREAGTVWTVPLNGDTEGRYPPGAAAAVWKSVDGGATWADKREGLPQEACFFTVLRQAMAVDSGDPAGVYFGTNTGSVFASADEGESWAEVARHLPTVLSVDVLERG